MAPFPQFRHRFVSAIVVLAIVGAAHAAEAPNLSELHEIQRRAAVRLALGDVLGALSLTRGEGGRGHLTGVSQSWNRQQIAELLAAVGKHRESLALLRSDEWAVRDPNVPTDAERSFARRVPLQPAIDRLLEAARTRQVLMFNEEHWRPEHRAFGALMLPKLRHLGFRYLALEDRDQPPLDEAMRTGRVTVRTDPYCYDPQRANLLRSALQSGMKIVAFDVSDPAELAEMQRDPLIGPRREDWMARNIQQRILERDPAAKIVIWVGMGHIAKKPLDVQGKSIEFMALRFWKRTGINPYCINQISDSGDDETDRRVYRLMVKLRVTPRRPFFIESPKEVSSSGRDPVPACFRIFDDLGLDALVLHPPRPFESGHRRPEWQTRLQTRRVNGRLTQLLAGYDPSARYLVQALDLAEGPDAAATDQVMPSPEGRFTLTVFPQRRYRIRVWALPVGALEGHVALERPLP